MEKAHTNAKRFIHWAEVEPVEMVPGVERRTLGYGEQVMLVEFRCRAGVEVPRHAHPHEQVGYVVSGQVELSIGDETRRCGPGDSYAIPGGVEHSARFPGECVVIDCFSPPREDYLR